MSRTNDRRKRARKAQLPQQQLKAQVMPMASRCSSHPGSLGAAPKDSNVNAEL
jgi:hypothetical protein